MVDSSGEAAPGFCAVETYESARRAEVTHDFCALVVNPSTDGAAVNFETGAQNCEREPFSDSASVDRCLPAAISRRSSSLPCSVGEVPIACCALTCIT